MLLPRRDIWEDLSAPCIQIVLASCQTVICVCIFLSYLRKDSLPDLCACSSPGMAMTPGFFWSSTASKGSQGHEEGLIEEGSKPTAGGPGMETSVIWSGHSGGGYGRGICSTSGHELS